MADVPSTSAATDGIFYLESHIFFNEIKIIVTYV
jgi:hypothetical protein